MGKINRGLVPPTPCPTPTSHHNLLALEVDLNIRPMKSIKLCRFGWWTYVYLLYATVGTWPAIASVTADSGAERSGAGALLFIYGLPSTMISVVTVGEWSVFGGGTLTPTEESILLWLSMLCNAWLANIITGMAMAENVKRGGKHGAPSYSPERTPGAVH